ncbi:MAG: hypothetical protein AAF636_04565 [Pseudomonadota bacterium]
MIELIHPADRNAVITGVDYLDACAGELCQRANYERAAPAVNPMRDPGETITFEAGQRVEYVFLSLRKNIHGKMLVSRERIVAGVKLP